MPLTYASEEVCVKDDGFLLFVALLVETVQLVSILTQTQKGSWWGLPRPPFFPLSERVTLGNPHQARALLGGCRSAHGSLMARDTLGSPSGISSYISLCIFI